MADGVGTRYVPPTTHQIATVRIVSPRRIDAASPRLEKQCPKRRRLACGKRQAMRRGRGKSSTAAAAEHGCPMRLMRCAGIAATRRPWDYRCRPVVEGVGLLPCWAGARTCPSDEITSPVLVVVYRGYETTGAREVQVGAPCRPQQPGQQPSIGNPSVMYPDVPWRIRYMERPGEPVHRISEGRWCKVPGLHDWQGPRCAWAWTHQHRSITRLRSAAETSTRTLEQILQRNCARLEGCVQGPEISPIASTLSVVMLRRENAQGTMGPGIECQVIPLVG